MVRMGSECDRVERAVVGGNMMVVVDMLDVRGWV